jgi:hypothetical protein
VASFLAEKIARAWNGKASTVSAQEHKAIQEMPHEELEAALPKLREEAARADARVHEAMERLAQTADIPTYVEVHDDYLMVDVRGVEKAMKLLSRLRIPLESTCRAPKQTPRSSTRCGEDGEYLEYTCQGSGSTTYMATQTRPS